MTTPAWQHAIDHAAPRVRWDGVRITCDTCDGTDHDSDACPHDVDATTEQNDYGDPVAHDRPESEPCQRLTPGCCIDHRSDTECQPW